MREETLHALVLAGAPNRGKLAQAAPEPWEALIPVGDRPMVLYVLDALRAAGSVESAVLVGPAELDPFLAGYPWGTGSAPAGTSPWLTRVDSGSSLMENLKRGLRVLPQDGFTLVVTGDAVLLNGEVLRRFLADCREADRRANVRHEVFYPIVTRQGMERLLPGSRRTYVRLADGEFTGGNIFLMSPSVVDKAGRLLEEAVAWRKQPWRLARLFGWRFLAALVLKRLKIATVERVVAERMGIAGKAIVTDAAEIGFDVDKPVDLDMARQWLGRGSAGGGFPAAAAPGPGNA